LKIGEIKMSKYVTPWDLLEELRGYGISDESILNYLVSDYFPHHLSLEALKNAKEEFIADEDEDEDEDDY
jgi:uncharacterized protein (DUF433 family)